MVKKFAPHVDSILAWTANKGLNDIYCEKALTTITTLAGTNGKENFPKKFSSDAKIRHNKLKDQLPDGIYDTISALITHVKSKITNVKTDSVTYSPMMLMHKEFGPCKRMKYNKGNIITGRDKEIESILLTLCKKDKRGVILVGEPGVGKAQPSSSKIRTPSGWTTMGKIGVGDSVICPDGTSATVDGVFPQGEKDVVELIFEDGRVVDCCTEHLWKVYSKNWKRLGSESRIVETNLILDYLSKTSENLYINLPEPINGNEKVPFSPYILGTMLGDGSLTHGPQITNRNTHIHNKWKNEVAENHTVNIVPTRNTFTCSITSNIRTSNIYRNFLRYYNLDCKSIDKYIPYEFLESTVENKTQLLQGLIDTDGTVTKTGTLYYSTSSPNLKNDVEYLVRSLGGYAKSKKKQPKYKYKGKIKEGKTSYTITIRIKDPWKYVTLPEKLERISKNYQYNDLKLKISSFRTKPREKCCCIYVNHKDHLYITDNFVVTHNTAIVHAINSRLIQRNVPRQLIGAEILTVDIPYIFSKYKEDPLGVVIGILETASTYDKAILFIDEVHQLLGQKMNDIMKPYLTEKIRFIGSTTLNEYHSIVTDDTALERRFTLVPVDEPSIDRTVHMVNGTKSVFEEHHKCTIPEDVCKYLVETGGRFLGHRRNPDKSLDLLDIACSIMYEKEIKQKCSNPRKSDDFWKRIERETQRLKSLRTITDNRVLTTAYVDMAISNMTGISYGEIANSLNYNQVRKEIQNEIFGQDEAIKSVANVVNIFKHIRNERTRPVSMLLMVGPAGTGKKSVAQSLAKQLFGKKDYFIDYDMSSFKSEFTISELKGSPPGYVGYGKSGRLIKSIRNNPQSVVYFRGIDKAHSTIKQYLLDGCRSGKLTDTAEREAKLNNTIIIFSVTLSDTQLEELQKGKARKSMGFSKNTKEEKSDSKSTKDALIPIIGEELVNSVDDVVFFDKLDDKVLKKIFDSRVQEFLDMYSGVDIDLKKLRKQVLEDTTNGHDVITRLSSEIPKQVFKKYFTKE